MKSTQHIMIEIKNLTLQRGLKVLLNQASATITPRQRIGLIGKNGTGKSSLFALLKNEITHDSGEISIPKNWKLAAVSQETPALDISALDYILQGDADLQQLQAALQRAEVENNGALIADYHAQLEEIDAYTAPARAAKLLSGLGFSQEEHAKPVKAFSGGWRMRLNLAQALMCRADLLLLDEPTNHLDLETVLWLENHLASLHCTQIIISHDRFFLDRVATHILDLSGGTVTAYAGNYSYFQKVHAERQKSLLAAYEKQQEHIKRTEEYIRRYRAGIKAKQARGRESQLRRMERIVLPAEKASFSYFAFHPPAECADRVAELEDVTFAFGSRAVFSHLSLLVRKGDGIAIVGPNGAGKTTLLRVLLGELAAQTGRVKIGSRVKIGYFSQQHEGLNPENTLVGELNYDFGIAEDEARKYLGAFLFHGDEVFRRIGDLSGGEQARLAFLKLMLTGANFLVLDEPTNHLDIPAREAVEEALMAFPGTFVVVSHDRYFLDKVANTTAELADGSLREYEGNYSYYRMKKEIEEKEAAEAAEERAGGAKRAAKKSVASVGRRAAGAASDVSPTQAGAAAGAASGAAASKTAAESAAVRKEQEQRRLASLSDAKRTEMLARAEAEIAMAEAELKGLEFEMNRPEVQGDPEKSAEIAELYAAKEQEIEERYARWEALAD